MKLQQILLASLLSIVVIGCSSSTTTDKNTDTKSPTIPTGLSVTPKDKALSLNWVPNTESDLERYEIYWGTQEANLGASKKVDSSETSAVLEGLNNGTTYYTAIRAVDDSGNKSGLSSVRSATPTEAITTGGSSTPTNFTVVAGDKEIRVSWSSSRDDVREYVIYWGTSLSTLSQSKRVDESNQSVTIEGLSNGTTYFVAMSAIDNTGNESDRTAVVSSTPVDSNTQPPSTPKALVVVPGDGKATVSWSANIEPDLSGYTIYWGTDETSLSQSKRVPASATSTEIVGLSNGTIYYVAMSANDTANSESERTKSQPVTPFKPDTTAPAIARTTPGENADISSPITIKFSETMDVGSVKVTLEPNVNLNAPVWSENATLLTLDPKEDFAYGSRYAVRVVGNDKAGNALSGSTSFSFTTRTVPDTTAPKVATTSFGDGAATVPTTANIAISFDEAMNQESVESAFGIEPTVECTFTWTRESDLINCDPKSNLDYSTFYEVTLSTEARDNAGNKLSQEVNFSFVTASSLDTMSPTIINSSPLINEKGIARDSSITVKFSEPMDAASVQQAFAITEPNYYVPSTNEFSWDNDFTEMKYKPRDGFYYGQIIKWRISEIAEDRAGNRLETLYASEFRIRQIGYTNLYSTDWLDGYVSSNGAVSVLDQQIYVGNDSDNTFRRAFFTFDLNQLPDDVLGVAYAGFYTNQAGFYGSPQSNLTTVAQPGLILESVNYGGSLDSGDFETPAINFCGEIVDCNSTVLISMYENSTYYTDVTSLIKYGFARSSLGDTNVQFRLRFPRNQSSSYDYIYFNADYYDYSYRPYISISYEYP